MSKRYGRRGTGKASKGWPKKPGALVYGGGAVHEVLSDGYTLREREDLVPGAPARLWKPKFMKSLRKDHPDNTRSEAAKKAWRTARRRNGRKASAWRKALRTKRFRGGEHYRAVGDDGRTRTRTYKAKRGDRRPKRWIQKAHVKKGALHRMLKIPLGKKIPLAVLRRASRAPGLLGKRARFALNVRKLGKKESVRTMNAEGFRRGSQGRPPRAPKGISVSLKRQYVKGYNAGFGKWEKGNS